MKCPQCPATFSELRDLCPQCLTDLRTFKREAGLPISAPEASYAELLSKNLKKRPSAPAPSNQHASGGVQEIVQRVRFVIGPRPGLATPLKTSNRPGTSSSAQKTGDRPSAPQTSAPEPAAVPMPPIHSAAVSTTTPPASQQAPECSPKSSPQQRQQAEPPLDLRQASDAQLFEAACTSLGTSFFELGAEQILRPHNRDEVLILFDLGDEALTDPEAARRYQTEITRSASRKIEATGLTARLKQIERMVEAPRLMLRQMHGRQHPDESPSAAVTESVIEVTSAPLATRICAAALQFLGLSAAAALLCTLYAHLSSAYSISWDFSTRDAIASTFALSAAFFVVLLPLLGGVLGCFGLPPLALRINKLALVCENGRPAKPRNFIVRAFSAPLALLCLGWLPLLWGRQALHDRLARTIVVGRAEEARLRALIAARVQD